MYTPEHVRAIDPTGTARVIAEAPLACIVARPADGLVANPVPVLAAADGAPIGHVALANDMNRRILAGQEVLAIFRGADGSVSPNCYPSKAEHHRHVPTWNYQAVHVTGVIT